MSNGSEDKLEKAGELERLRAEKADLEEKFADHEAEIDVLTRQLQDTQHLLEESRDRYADLYDFAPVGYITLTYNGLIKEANATFAAMTSLNQLTLPGTPFNLFLATTDDLNAFLSHLDRCRKEGGKVSTDLRMKRQNNAFLHAQLISVPSADYTSRTVTYRTAVMDLTERRQAEEEKEQARRQLQLIMDSAPVPIGYLDKDEKFIYVNAEYLKKFELESRQVIGRTFWEVHGREPDDLLGENIRRGIAGQGSELESEVSCGITGTKYFLRVSIAPDCSTGETPCGIVIVGTDLTEQKRNLEEIREAKEAAERANRGKSQFLANMSHELRTPMNGVLGMLQLLIQGYAGSLQPQQQELATKASKSANALIGIINDILDLSKIEAGKFVLEVKPFSVRHCVTDTMELFSHEAQQKGLTLEYSLAEDLPETTLGDPVRLRQVLINLLGNALKFTDQGRISLQVTAGKIPEEGKCKLIFTVTDTGIGIPEEKKELLFRPFSQIDPTDTRKFGGTGLGLVICNRIISMMGGNISVESKEGAGSSFSFTLPLEEVEAEIWKEAEAPSAEIEEHGAEAGQKTRILVAEDDLQSSDLLKVILEKHGYEMELARTGSEAVEKWEKNGFDLVIMDVQMPKMDGLAATRLIREKEQTRGGHTPILAMTAHAYREEGERCLAAGMDEFLTKPLDLKKGIETIRGIIRKT